MKVVLWTKLICLVLAHIVLCFVNVASFFLAPLYEPFYVACPIMSLILVMSLAPWWICPLTQLENKFRKELGLKEVHGFVGHYVIRPLRRLVRGQKQRIFVKET